MTENTPYALPLMFMPRAHSKTTNDTFRKPLLTCPGTPAPRVPRSSVQSLACLDDRASNGILLGLFAATLPAVAYGLIQMWSLISSGSLDQAIRAFVP